MTAFDALLGRMYSRGVEVELGSGIDALAPLYVTYDPATSLLRLGLTADEIDYSGGLAADMPGATAGQPLTWTGSAWDAGYWVACSADPATSGAVRLGHADGGVSCKSSDGTTRQLIGLAVGGADLEVGVYGAAGHPNVSVNGASTVALKAGTNYASTISTAGYSVTLNGATALFVGTSQHSIYVAGSVRATVTDAQLQFANLQGTAQLGAASSRSYVRADNLRVGASYASATTPGSVVGKIEVFDASGVSRGFLPVYSSIT